MVLGLQDALPEAFAAQAVGHLVFEGGGVLHLKVAEEGLAGQLVGQATDTAGESLARCVDQPFGIDGHQGLGSQPFIENGCRFEGFVQRFHAGKLCM